jgi:RimJ/RimL family protein N-acetyltransferase
VTVGAGASARSELRAATPAVPALAAPAPPAAFAILVAIAAGLVLLGTAMRLYPGGNAIDHAARGHSFWSNFLCDLTSTTAGDGRRNDLGAGFAKAAMLAFAIALACFWSLLPATLRAGRVRAAAIRALGALSVAGLVAAPFTVGWMHAVAILGASAPALGAGLLGLVELVKSSRRLTAGVACATVTVSAIDAVLYARSYLTHPRVVPPALPLFQRIAFLLMLIWMAVTAWEVLRRKGRALAPRLAARVNPRSFPLEPAMRAQQTRWAAEHRSNSERLLAIEPTGDELAAAAPALAAFYNDPHNRRMLANTITLTPPDVIASYEELRAAGGRPFLLFAGDRLVGDGDLRHLDAVEVDPDEAARKTAAKKTKAGEVAILVGERTTQGRGLGTRFAVMLHAFAFRVLELEQIYASILPANAVSLRLFTRLGYLPDASPAARAFADEPDDVTLAVTRARFETATAATLAEVRLHPRDAAV